MALLLGALIGLEREVHQATMEDAAYFGGIRTFPLIALCGALSAFVAAQVWAPFIGVALGVMGLLLVASYVQTSRTARAGGVTTEVSGLLTFMLGVMAEHRLFAEAFALAVAVMGLLRMKRMLHQFSHSLDSSDMEAILKFGVVSAIILPLLPDHNYGPPPYDVFNPRHVWFVVVLISAISFAGYIAIRLLGPGRGLPLTGLFGGLVSSTAVTISFARRVVERPNLALLLALGVIAANLVMVPRIALVVAAVDASLLMTLAPGLIAMLLAGAIPFAVLWRLRGEEGRPADAALQFANPLRLSTAITFGLLFAVVLALVQVAQVHLSDRGTYLVAILSGAPDVNAIVLSLAKLHSAGDISGPVATRGILLAAVSNGAVKLFTAVTLGTGRFRIAAGGALLAMSLAGIAAAVWLV